MMSANDIIVRLNLQPHPEGGFFRETFRQQPESGTRGSLALIYYLLPKTHRSAWHRIDATEIWHFVCGDPLRLTLFSGSRGRRHVVVGARLEAEESPNVVVEPRGPG